MLYEVTVRLIPKPHKDPIKMRTSDTLNLINVFVKILKILTNRIQDHPKIIHHDQLSFVPEMQAWFNIQKSINLIHYINQYKEKEHMIISLDAEKANSTLF